MSEHEPLRKFIFEEMGKRNMSMRQFADLLDMPLTSLHRFMNEKEGSKPSIELMTKLMKLVERPTVVLDLVFPNITDDVETSLTAQWVAQHFDKLPDNFKNAIIEIINGVEAVSTGEKTS